MASGSGPALRLVSTKDLSRDTWLAVRRGALATGAMQALHGVRNDDAALLRPRQGWCLQALRVFEHADWAG